MAGDATQHRFTATDLEEAFRHSIRRRTGKHQWSHEKCMLLTSASQASETATAAPSSQQGVSATANVRLLRLLLVTSPYSLLYLQAGDSNNATLESIARELFPEWSAINVKSMAGRITGQLAS